MDELEKVQETVAGGIGRRAWTIALADEESAARRLAGAVSDEAVARRNTTGQPLERAEAVEEGAVLLAGRREVPAQDERR